MNAGGGKPEVPSTVDEPLVIAVSPYHLTTREAPALAALLLADEVVTLLPAPPAGRTRDDVIEATQKSPRYLRMMESWRWTVPLWLAGIIGSSYDDADVGEELRGCYDRISAEDEYAGLRPLTRHLMTATADEFLDLLAADILRGGPDPGMNIPVSAAIDDFAARHGIVVARSTPTSVAQRAEVQLGRRVFALALPMLSRASARVILMARDELRPELESLRRELGDACRAAPAAAPGDAGPAQRLGAAQRDYAAAFETLQSRIAGRDDDEGVRVTTGFVGVTGFVLPSDVAMRSGLAAARAMNMRGAPAARAGAPVATTAPERLVVLVVKALNARPSPATA